MIETRFKKLAGVNAGQTYVIVAPYSEIANPIQFTLQLEGDAGEKLIVDEDELADRTRWEPVGE